MRVVSEWRHRLFVAVPPARKKSYNTQPILNYMFSTARWDNSYLNAAVGACGLLKDVHKEGPDSIVTVKKIRGAFRQASNLAIDELSGVSVKGID